MDNTTLKNISPIDGRYSEKVKELQDIFSEYGLIRNRVKIEIEYYISLGEKGIFKLKNKSALRKIYNNFSLNDAKKVKEIEKKTNHDVKAVEYFLKSKIKDDEFIHFALTSEDVNNLSYSLMLKDGIEKLYPYLSQLYNKLIDLKDKYSGLPMLSRTHGQAASPTTLGKEFAIYCDRLSRMVDSLKNVKILGKLNGASGNFNAHHQAFPKVDWISFSLMFIKKLGLEPNIMTYQIEPHDGLAQAFHALARINTVVINLDQDIWSYISMDYISQKTKKGEVGSSTMPHKVNPIDFENSEGNLGLSSSILLHMAQKLPITRLQRDLSDSTVIRNQGTALAYMLVGIKSTLKGLDKIKANEKKIKDDLNVHPEILAEAIQTVLRREGYPMPYEKLKSLTRGKRISLDVIHGFLDKLNVPVKLKEELKRITPESYTGLAEKLTINFK